MDSRNDRIAILLSVTPRFADHILSGNKKVEFRRVKFPSSVKHIVLYATSPIKRVVGFFEVDGIDEGSPHELWQRYHRLGSVEEEFFRTYYEGVSLGYAIQVGQVYALINPISLNDLCGFTAPPQSFRYLEGNTIARLMQMARGPCWLIRVC